MIFVTCVLVSSASARARSTTATCAGRKGTPVAPAVGMRAAEHWVFAFCALGTTFCTLRAHGVWSAAGIWTNWIGLAHRTAGLGAFCAPPKGSLRGMVPCLSWPGYFFGNPHMADTRKSDTTNLVLMMLAKVSRTVDKPYRQGTATLVGFLPGTSLQLAAPLAGNLHTVDRHSSDTTSLASPLVSKVCYTVGRLWRSLPPRRLPSANMCDKCRRWLWSHTGASGTR